MSEETSFGGYLLMREDITKEMWEQGFNSNFGYIPGAVYTRINTDRKYEYICVEYNGDNGYLLKFKELDTEYEDDETIVDAFNASMYFNRKENKDD